MKRSVLVALLTGFTVVATWHAPAKELFPLCVTNLSPCGFVDRSGDWVIDPVFERVERFGKNGLAPASINRKFGYIDIAGKWVIEPQFYDADEFEDSGVADVKIDYDNAGLIDKTGAFIFGPVEGSIYTNVVWDFAEVKVDGKSGIVDDAGNWVVKPILDDIDWWPKSELVVVKQGDLWGYIDKQGKWAIEPKYTTAYEFAENGLARAAIMSLNNFSLLFGFTNFNEGYIDQSGEWVIPRKFRRAEDFSSAGLAPAREQDSDLFGIIDATGEWVVEPQFHSVRKFGGNGLAVAMMDDKAGAIDASGAWVIEPRFDRISGFSVFNEAEAAMGEDWDSYKWGIIDEKGEWIIQPLYDSVTRFRDRDLTSVSVDEKYGLVDRSGDMVIPLVFSEVRFGDDLIKVTFGNPLYHDNTAGLSEGYLDATGKPLTFKRFW